jgi:hydroxyquinol 1,2-dioxygenase
LCSGRHENIQYRCGTEALQQVRTPGKRGEPATVIGKRAAMVPTPMRQLRKKCEEHAMHDLDETTVTQAVLDQMATTADPRLREIMAAAVRHLHAFAREVNLTPAEWLTGIAFMTEIGKSCTASRQETILLSDVLGLSAMVNALHDKTRLDKATDTSLLGQFYRETSPVHALGDSIVAKPDSPEIVFYGQVRDLGGRGIPHARVEVWQTDEHGFYDMQMYGDEKMDMRGTFTCDGEGKFHFRTVKPLGYYIPMDGPVGRLIRAQGRQGCRPAHIHFLITADGYRELVTSLYQGDDQYIDSDVVFGVSSSLIIQAKPDPASPFPELDAIHYNFGLARAAAAGEARIGADPSKLVKAE